MTIKVSYANESEIPAGLETYYKQVGEKWVLQAEGLKTDEDVARLQESLRKERNDHAEAKKALKPFTDLGLDPSELAEKLDKFEELSIMTDSSKIEEQVAKLSDARIKANEAKYTRELEKLNKDLAEKTQAVEQFQQVEKQRKIYDAVTQAATEAGIQVTALEDVKILAERHFDVTEDGQVLTKDSMYDPKVWLTEIKEKRPHWWPVNQGGNATGSNGGFGKGVNPFSKKSWNLTEQGRIMRENPDLAAQYQKSAQNEQNV